MLEFNFRLQQYFSAGDNLKMLSQGQEVSRAWTSQQVV